MAKPAFPITPKPAPADDGPQRKLAAVAPVDPGPVDPPTQRDDMETFGEMIADEIVAAKKELLSVIAALPAPSEPLAPIVNVASAVPTITVVSAENPAPIVNVETAAPVINVLPAAAPSFNFHADSASVGFDINTVVEQLAAIVAGQTALQDAMMSIARAMDRQSSIDEAQSAAILHQGQGIAAIGRALLEPRELVMDAAGKPVGIKIKG